MKEQKFRTLWARMPLETGSLRKIPKGHERRPYLILLEEKDFYYAFPCTSNVFGYNTRYNNCKLILRNQNTYSRKSLVQLEAVYKLPKSNLLFKDEKGYILSPKEVNELLKKIKANAKFSQYPQAVIDFISEIPTSLCINDLISHNDNLYIIISRIKYQKGFYCLSVSNQPFNKAVLVEEDTNKYYININEVHHIVPNETTEYKSIIAGFASREKEMSLDDVKTYLKRLKNFVNTYPRYAVVSSSFYEGQQIQFGMLPPGTVISYLEDGIQKKMVILKTESTNQVVLEGLANQMYKDYKVCYYPSDFSFDFKVENTISDERVEELIKKKLNVEDRKLQYIW